MQEVASNFWKIYCTTIWTRRYRGVEAMMADAASVSVMVEGMGSRSSRWMHIKQEIFLWEEMVGTSGWIFDALEVRCRNGDENSLKSSSNEANVSNRNYNNNASAPSVQQQEQHNDVSHNVVSSNGSATVIDNNNSNTGISKKKSSCRQQEKPKVVDDLLYFTDLTVCDYFFVSQKSLDRTPWYIFCYKLQL